MRLPVRGLPLALALGLVCRMATGLQQADLSSPLASRYVWNTPASDGGEAVQPASAPMHAQAPAPASAPGPGHAARATSAGPCASAWGSPAAAPAAAPARGLRAGTEQSASPEDAVFVQGMLPLDDRGQTVQAHGGGMLRWGGRFYWVGEGAKPGCEPGEFGQGCDPIEREVSQVINLYSSPDLASWTFEGVLLNQAGIRDMPCGGVNASDSPCRMERPKMLYNQGTRQFVLFFHLDTAGFTAVPGQAASGHVGILTADKVTGPYTWARALLPDGFGSYDMSVFQEPDGTAYLVRSLGSQRNDHIGISRLMPDYLDTSGGGVCSQGPRGEGVAIFSEVPGNNSGGYYLLNSNQTWWDPNPPQLSYASTLCGEAWRLLPRPTAGAAADTTFDSQPTFVLPFRCASGQTVLMYLGDRWNFRGPGGLANASYVWLPLVPAPNGYTIQDLQSWRLGDFC